MYRLAKSIAVKIVRPAHLFRYEMLMRRFIALFYSGNTHMCSICTKKLRKFITLHNDDLLCPACGSLARDRRLWTLLKKDYLNDGATVLDFSPSRSIARNMLKENIEYRSTDLSGNFLAKYSYDITSLPLNDSFVDLIVCYHILEHIDDDAKAMHELYRVLKPKGIALVQTPFKDGDIYENAAVTTPEERLQHFGQDDHVRIYSVQGLSSRLKKAGFNVVIKSFDADSYRGLFNETVLIISKPNA